MTSQEQLIQQLHQLGVIPGCVLVVHCAFSKVKPVENGPLGLIASLQQALEDEGTLVMPSMMGDEPVPFDPKTTQCLDMGVVANTFWQQPGILRSDCPHAFSATGPQAEWITSAHPIDPPHGLDSPVGRVYELDGYVLLLGVGHDANTTVHLAEDMAGVRYRRQTSVPLYQDGKLIQFDYEEIDHCCENFNKVDQWLDAEQLQRKGTVGHAKARLMRSRDVVNVVTARLQQEETIFLHPYGVDEECDEARASIGIGSLGSISGEGKSSQ